MSLDHGLYSQVVMLCRNHLKTTEANKNKNESKFKFQGQSARSQRWFDPNFDWIGVNFSTHEPDFYRKIFQKNDDTKDTHTFKILEFTIRNLKCVEKLSFTVMPQCSSIVKIH